MLLSVLFATLALQDPPARPATVDFHVDLALVRELGWVPADASDDVALAAAAARARREAGQSPADLRIEEVDGEPRLRLTFAESVKPDAQLVLTGWLESIGTCCFLAVIDDERAQTLAIDLAAERAKLTAWVAKHPSERLAAFNCVAEDAGGPCAGLVWLTHGSRVSLAGEPQPQLERALPLEIPAPEEAFGARHFTQVSALDDELGWPVISFVLDPARALAFGAFTERLLGRLLAVVVADKIVCAPYVRDRLPAKGILNGFQTVAERDACLADLQADPPAGVFRVIESR